MTQFLFIKLIRNKTVFNEIINNIKYIHRDVLKKKIIVNWLNLLHTPQLLVEYQYDNIIKEEILQKSHHQHSQQLLVEIVSISSRLGRLDLIQYILESSNCKWFKESFADNCNIYLEEATNNYHLNVIQFLEPYIGESNSYIYQNSIDILLNNNTSINNNNNNNVIDNKKSEILKWFFNHLDLEDLEDCIIKVVRAGRYNDFLWMLSEKQDRFDDTEDYSYKYLCQTALDSKNYDIIRHLYMITSGGCFGSYQFLSYFAKDGRLEDIKWYYDKRADLISIEDAINAYSSACLLGYIDIVEYLHSKNASHSYINLDIIVSRGHFNIIKWYGSVFGKDKV